MNKLNTQDQPGDVAFSTCSSPTFKVLGFAVPNVSKPPHGIYKVT